MISFVYYFFVIDAKKVCIAYCSYCLKKDKVNTMPFFIFVEVVILLGKKSVSDALADVPH